MYIVQILYTDITTVYKHLNMYTQAIRQVFNEDTSNLNTCTYKYTQHTIARMHKRTFDTNKTSNCEHSNTRIYRLYIDDKHPHAHTFAHECTFPTHKHDAHQERSQPYNL